MEYSPRPLDTSNVTLPSELLALRERLAENVHEIWAAQRLEDGWRYGERRDDLAKTHPSLVSFADLPETEKAYDRQTAMGTLKAVLALGYQISPTEQSRR